MFAQELSLTVAYVDVKGTLLIDRNMDIVVTTPKTLIKMLRRSMSINVDTEVSELSV